MNLIRSILVYASNLATWQYSNHCISYQAGSIKPDELACQPFVLSSPLDTLLACAAGLRNFVLAYATVFLLHNDKNPYPAFGPARELDLGWMVPIVVRNTIATWVICGFWDWFLYFSPMQVTVLPNRNESL